MIPFVQPSWILKTHPRSPLNHQSSFHRFLLTAVISNCPLLSILSSVYSVIISPMCSYIGETQIYSYLSPLLLIVMFKALQSLSSVNYILCFISIHLVSNPHNQSSCQSKLLAVPAVIHALESIGILLILLPNLGCSRIKY